MAANKDMEAANLLLLALANDDNEADAATVHVAIRVFDWLVFSPESWVSDEGRSMVAAWLGALRAWRDHDQGFDEVLVAIAPVGFFDDEAEQ